MNYEELTKEQLISIHKDTLLYLGEVNKEYEDLEKEIERLNNIIKEQELEDKPNYYVKGLEGSLKEYQQEIERLNNIINELEKWLDKKEKLTFNSWNKGIHEVQRKLQELKGSDK